MCKWQKMGAFHSCRVQKHPGRWGGIVLTRCPLVLIVQPASPEGNEACKPGDVQDHYDGRETRVCCLRSLSSPPQHHNSTHTFGGSSQPFADLSHFFFVPRHVFIALTWRQCEWDWWTSLTEKCPISLICFKIKAHPWSAPQNNMPAQPGFE